MNTTQYDHRASTSAHLASIGIATPDFAIDQQQAADFLLHHYADKLSARNRKIIEKIFAHPGVRKRKLALENLESLIDEDPDKRTERFTHFAVDLAAQAIRDALAKTSISLREITALVVNTCTGYICPGLSTYLIQKMGLSNEIKTFDLVGSGCGGAIPNLQLAESLLKTNGKGAVVTVSVEICSATFQMEDDLSLIISNALFADGAAAAILVDHPGEWQLLASANRTAPDYRESVRYVHKNGQLHNQLATNLPDLVNTFASQVVHDILEPRALSLEDVKFWALHPGGEKIINSVKDGLRLNEKQLRPTRNILAQYGNMSSPTVLFVFEEILQEEIQKGDLCMMVAFGAGLSAHGFLLRKN